MLTILSTILGFVGPFLPQVLKYFQQKQDNAQELAVMRLQAEIAERQHTLKLEEINVRADVAESVAIRAPVASFGVQVLDAAKGQGMAPWLWVPVFWAFALLDWVSGMVRPLITYSVVLFWMAYKYALLTTMASDRWQDALVALWNQDDLAVLFLVLGYWFGTRAVKAHFGGSASTGKPGGG